MALFPKRNSGSDTAASGKPTPDPVRSAGMVPSAEDLRRRARHRLIGSAVLVVVGVIAFPLLFDAEPRTVSPAIPIAMDGKVDTPAPSAVAARHSLADNEEIIAEPKASAAAKANGSVTGAATGAAAGSAALLAQNTQAAADREAASKAKAAAERQAQEQERAAQEKAAREEEAHNKAAAEKESRGKAAAEKAAADKAAAQKAAADKAAADKAAREKAAREKAAREKARQEEQRKAAAEKAAADKAAAEKKATAEHQAAAKPAAKEETPAYNFPEKGRFVVQVGAYVEENRVAQVRQKLSAAGLNNFTQKVKVNGKDVTRVRMGPFNSRQEMERVAAKVRALGLPVQQFSY